MSLHEKWFQEGQKDRSKEKNTSLMRYEKNEREQKVGKMWNMCRNVENISCKRAEQRFFVYELWYERRQKTMRQTDALIRVVASWKKS